MKEKVRCIGIEWANSVTRDFEYPLLKETELEGFHNLVDVSFELHEELESCDFEEFFMMNEYFQKLTDNVQVKYLDYLYERYSYIIDYLKYLNTKNSIHPY